MSDVADALVTLGGEVPVTVPVAVPELDLPAVDAPLDPELLGDLHAPDLVLSTDYVGADRRGAGRWARVRRATFGQRSSLLRLEVAIAALVALVVVVMVALPGSQTTPSSRTGVRALSAPSTASATHAGTATVPSRTAPDRTASNRTSSHATPPPASSPSSTAATTSPPAAAAAAAPPPPAAPPATAPPATAPPADPTPQQLGAQALTLVRYPWQAIPGYSIQFLPIGDAPSPGFYGNTDFTWGQAGGTSTLYVFPGETVSQLAGIIAFEIAHEVDAAAVEPEGGHTQIENILGIHPATWAPNCDCAEQGYLSGWYAAAFSNYWSPGVGQWSTIAAEPTGSVLAAVEPWLNPTIP